MQFCVLKKQTFTITIFCTDSMLSNNTYCSVAEGKRVLLDVQEKKDIGSQEDHRC